MLSFLSLKVSRPQARLVAPVIFITGTLSTVLGSKVSSHRTLAAATISWAIIYLTCWKISNSREASYGSRFAPKPTPDHKRKRLVLAGCILGQTVCEGMAIASNSNPSTLTWAKACVPVTFLLLRRADIGGLWSNESPVAGRRKLIIILTAAALISTVSTNIERSVILGTSVVGYSALCYSYIEEILSEISDISSNDELLSTIIPVGRQLGLYLIFAFGVLAVTFENFQNGTSIKSQGHDWNQGTLIRVLSIGILGALRWILIPFLVSQTLTISVPFLDLSIALVIVLGIKFSIAKLVGSMIALGAMAIFFTQSKSGSQKAVLTLFYLSLGIFVLITCIDLFYSHGFNTEILASSPLRAPLREPSMSTNQHPIIDLIRDSELRYNSMRKTQSKTLAEAIIEYQRRYKMNPPPNFNKWYEFARERNVELVDEYNTIYDGIKPFWGLEPREIRERAARAMGFEDEAGLKNNKFVHAYIRNGKVTVGGQGPDWQKNATAGMINTFASWLPDMNLPFNIHDEPRVVVNHDMLAQYLKRADQKITNSKGTQNQAKFMNKMEGDISKYPTTDFNVFAHQGIWTHATASCPPDSPARSIDSVADSTNKFLREPIGFVFNTSAQSDVCLSPGLETRFGLFDRPNAFNVVQRLYPVFSQSKVSTFGDILYPSPWYWAKKVEYNEALDMPWENKTSALYWRGSTTGGFSRNGGWRRQHRQRAVARIEADKNATILYKKEGFDRNWITKEVPRATLRTLFDAHFSGVGQCDEKDCLEQREYFNVTNMAAQNDAWKSKYLLDMDGNAFSGRYHAFLESKSTIFKLAIFREWHDEWLYPWVHYIPLSLEVQEVTEIMRFFVHEEGGEAIAKRIADEGRVWAKKVLTKDAMEVWFFRLLLEYGRVIDDRREMIGFTL